MGWFVDIEHADSVQALNRGLARWLAGEGRPRLTRSQLCGEERVVTTTVAQWVHRQTLDDGNRPHGIYYPSKHGMDAGCWAIWLRQIDDGADPSREPTTVLVSSAIKPPDRNPELKLAAETLNLHLC